ncbi:MAG: hypothetical protein KAI71_05445 [Candidatus Pacebacteria bacterium]|nr:hypothetical protein [Candidatus Paceibacterota bacterium]
MSFEENVMIRIRPFLKEYISDKRRSSVLLLASLSSLFVGIPLLYIVASFVETLSTSVAIVIFLVGIVVIEESFSILGRMSMYSWIFEYNDEGELPGIYISL